MSIELSIAIGIGAFMGSMWLASRAKVKRLERVISLQDNRYRLLLQRLEGSEDLLLRYQQMRDDDCRECLGGGLIMGNVCHKCNGYGKRI